MSAIYNKYKVNAVKLKIYIVNKSADYFCNVFGNPSVTTVWNPTTDADRMNAKLSNW